MKKVMIICLAVILLIGGISVFGPNTGTMKRGEYFCIHTGWNYDQSAMALKEGTFIRSDLTFQWVAKLLGLPQHLHPGRYHILPGMSNFEIVKLLRSGKQSSVKLIINKLRTSGDFISLLSQNLECDSTSVANLIHDADYLKQFDLDTATYMCALMPDTYEFFWNTTADKVFRKIEKNYSRFWTPTRSKQARDLGLSNIQVITIASIIEEETNKNEDKPNIASVYLNRLNKGMKLQADPTVKYAIGDFTIRRITGAMLNFESPYNTYLNNGLPPGPICTPQSNTIDAVLNSPKTTYLYFCAKEDLSGASVFATTYEEHMKNAARYQETLNKQGIH